MQAVSWTDGKCSVPTSCPVSECRSRAFTARRNHLLTETIDWQTIRSVCGILGLLLVIIVTSSQISYEVTAIWRDINLLIIVVAAAAAAVVLLLCCRCKYKTLIVWLSGARSDISYNCQWTDYVINDVAACKECINLQIHLQIIFKVYYI